MPYAARQLRCLSAMGLVAWRLREGSEPPAATPPAPVTASVTAPAAVATERAAPPVDPSVPPPPGPPSPGPPSPGPPAAVALPPGAEPLVAPVLATPLPREPDALAAWLPEQPLAPFVWKERRLTRIGRDDAPLLVVVEREPAETLPLDGDAAELFERMLGAIGRTRRDTCQCVLAAAPATDGDTVSSLAGPERPVTLVLVRELDGALDAPGCRLPGDPFGGGAWCLPHPEVLLAEPAAKRQAWLVLKAVRQHLPLLP